MRTCLQYDGYPVQGAPATVPLAFLVEDRGLVEQLGSWRQRDERIERGIVLLDLHEISLDDLDASYCTLSQEMLQSGGSRGKGVEIHVRFVSMNSLLGGQRKEESMWLWAIKHYLEFLY